MSMETNTQTNPEMETKADTNLVGTPIRPGATLAVGEYYHNVHVKLTDYKDWGSHYVVGPDFGRDNDF